MSSNNEANIIRWKPKWRPLWPLFFVFVLFCFCLAFCLSVCFVFVLVLALFSLSDGNFDIPRIHLSQKIILCLVLFCIVCLSIFKHYVSVTQLYTTYHMNNITLTLLIRKWTSTTYSIMSLWFDTVLRPDYISLRVSIAIPLCQACLSFSLYVLHHGTLLRMIHKGFVNV